VKGPSSGKASELKTFAGVVLRKLWGLQLTFGSGRAVRSLAVSVIHTKGVQNASVKILGYSAKRDASKLREHNRKETSRGPIFAQQVKDRRIIEPGQGEERKEQRSPYRQVKDDTFQGTRGKLATKKKSVQKNLLAETRRR